MCAELEEAVLILENARGALRADEGELARLTDGARQLRTRRDAAYALLAQIQQAYSEEVRGVGTLGGGMGAGKTESRVVRLLELVSWRARRSLPMS